METNTYRTMPAGERFTARYVSFTPTGCESHGGVYTLFCPRCEYAETVRSVTLGEDGVVAVVLDRDDGALLEWINADSGVDFARNVAPWGELVILTEALDAGEPVAVAAAHEAGLYADCFGG